METGKHVSGKQMFAGPSLTTCCRPDLDHRGLALFLPITSSSGAIIVIPEDSCLPGEVTLSQFL